MFTGIVHGTGVVRRSQVTGLDLMLVIDVRDLPEKDINIGDSVAVDGVCLTVVEYDKGCLRFDVSRETLLRTLLGSKLNGDLVNLELALLPTSRLGGHFVTGHVDGVGYLESLEHVGTSIQMRFRAPRDLSRFVAEKGSVCIDGVSLTVNAISENSFEVNIVPHTIEVTTMKDYFAGRKVHLEVDIIARYLDRLMTVNQPRKTVPAPIQQEPEPSEEITQEFLAKQGFVAPDLGE
ncbi:MAG: riboflavin synthase [Arenicellales bacterium]|nr:riboflavin synthase [Arenicellales bacterium]